MPKLATTLDVIRTIAAVAVPIIVAVVGYWLSQRLKELEANEWRNQELIKARLTYYQSLAPQLNDLMCYFTFIGGWKGLTPPNVISLKRNLDREFYSALPLFSPSCGKAYDRFMETCFATFGTWGRDACLKTGFVERRAAFGDAWKPEWQEMFTHEERQEVPKHELENLRISYAALLGALAEDVQLSKARLDYVTPRISLNAH